MIVLVLLVLSLACSLYGAFLISKGLFFMIIGLVVAMVIFDLTKK